MTNQIVTSIITGMFNYLNGEQLNQLKLVTTRILDKYDITEKQTEIATYEDCNNDLLLKFLAWKATEGKSPKTLRLYKFTIQKALSTIGKRVYDITETDIFLYIAEVKSRGKSNVYLNNIRLNLSSFFNWLYSKDFIKTNPIKGISSIKTKKEIKTAFTDVDLELLKLNAGNPRDIAIIEFLYSSGVRVSEMCSLNIADVDFVEKTAKVCGKGNKERIVYLSTTCVYYLRRYLATRNDTEEALFVGIRNKKRIHDFTVQAMLKKLGVECNIKKVHPHKFRRTLATNLLKKGMSIEEVCKILGHASINTTMIYCNLDNQLIKNEYMRIMN